MRDWKKNPPTEKEIEAANKAMELLKQELGDIETLFFATGERIFIGTVRGIRNIGSGKYSNEAIEVVIQ